MGEKAAAGADEVGGGRWADPKPRADVGVHTPATTSSRVDAAVTAGNKLQAYCLICRAQISSQIQLRGKYLC